MSETEHPRRRILLLLTSDLTEKDDCLRRATHRPDARVEVHCAVPPTPSRVNFQLTTDDRRELPQAQERLDRTLRLLHQHGVTASGRVGDLSAGPEQMIDDAISYFQPDEVVLVVHPSEEKHWNEDAMVKSALEKYALPIHIIECAETTTLAA